MFVSYSSVYSVFCSAGNVDSIEDPWTVANGSRAQHDYDSSSNSNSSSISSLSGSSSDSDFKTTGPNELEADADSLTCSHSVVSSGDQMENDGSKLVFYICLKM